jgi:hypothetical protein
LAVVEAVRLLLVKLVMQMPLVVTEVLELPHLLLEHLSLTLVAEAVVVNKVMVAAQKLAVLVVQVVAVQAVQVEQTLQRLTAQTEPQARAVVVVVAQQMDWAHHISAIKAVTAALAS